MCINNVDKWMNDIDYYVLLIIEELDVGCMCCKYFGSSF